MTHPFGLSRAERTASALLAFAGAAGLALSLLGLETALAARLLGEPWPAWFVPSPGLPWLVTQSLLVMFGAISALTRCRWLRVVASGVVAGAVFVTPVGLLTALPAAWMLLLIVLRYDSFWEFMGRGEEGPPRPGGPPRRRTWN